jgi:hypothetical protein
MRLALGPFVVLVPILLVLGPLGAVGALGAGWPQEPFVLWEPVGPWGWWGLGAIFGSGFGKARRAIMFLGADPPCQAQSLTNFSATASESFGSISLLGWWVRCSSLGCRIRLPGTSFKFVWAPYVEGWAVLAIRRDWLSPWGRILSVVFSIRDLPVFLLYVQVGGWQSSHPLLLLKIIFPVLVTSSDAVLVPSRSLAQF